MKLQCQCGNILHDPAEDDPEPLPYKAHFLSEEEITLKKGEPLDSTVKFSKFHYDKKKGL